MSRILQKINRINNIQNITHNSISAIIYNPLLNIGDFINIDTSINPAAAHNNNTPKYLPIWCHKSNTPILQLCIHNNIIYCICNDGHESNLYGINIYGQIFNKILPNNINISHLQPHNEHILLIGEKKECRIDYRIGCHIDCIEAFIIYLNIYTIEFTNYVKLSGCKPHYFNNIITTQNDTHIFMYNLHTNKTTQFMSKYINHITHSLCINDKLLIWNDYDTKLVNNRDIILWSIIGNHTPNHITNEYIYSNSLRIEINTGSVSIYNGDWIPTLAKDLTFTKSINTHITFLYNTNIPIIQHKFLDINHVSHVAQLFGGYIIALNWGEIILYRNYDTNGKITQINGNIATIEVNND